MREVSSAVRKPRDYVTGGACPSKATISGKTVIVTGANTGIGKQTALELARRGGNIILACRDMGKCEAAAKYIRGETLNHHVNARHLDLASLKSIREFAAKIIEEEERVDILINNAGVMRCPHWTTEDGFEMQFGVNHLGHFLLTNLLLDKLKASAPSRIINLSSLAHVAGHIDFDDLNWQTRKYNTKAAYCQSKLAIVLFTKELSRRLQGSGVTVNALHPGVARTELGRHTGIHGSTFSSTTLSVYPEVELLDFMAIPCLPFGGAAKTIFHSSGTMLRPCQQCTRGPISLHTHQYLLFSIKKNYSRSGAVAHAYNPSTVGGQGRRIN
ncbi:retinol dehydrogenase 13 isoform X3 [Hylobates moloch]|uniref:retinol dehydrogenase 13 isoform X3 n=1 Tax=Hylobates moloch TaxID=81572 RepID=UPI002675358D|nr:retinol dehydrogenase 13 isoform X3 [Hylobates moloch]